MVGEVTAGGIQSQTGPTRATEIESAQAKKSQTASPQPRPDVEVRISRADAQPARTEDLTYENIRPRSNGAPRADERPTTERSEEVRAREVRAAEAQTRQIQAERNASQPTT